MPICSFKGCTSNEGKPFGGSIEEVRKHEEVVHGKKYHCPSSPKPSFSGYSESKLVCFNESSELSENKRQRRVLFPKDRDGSSYSHEACLRNLNFFK